MNENLEIEYKVMVDQQAFERLRSFYPQATLIEQTNVYYSALAKPKKLFRIRDVEGRHTFTLKVKQAIGSREYELDLPENSPAALQDPQIQVVLAQFGLPEPYIRRGQLHTNRYTVALPEGLLCMDINRYNGIEDYEVEFEAGSAEPSALTFFTGILKRAGIVYVANPVPKSRRAVKNT